MNELATIDYQTLKINGIYRQNDAGDLMLRVKLPAGVISSVQAEALCDLSDAFSTGTLHLTCRGSIEMHGLRIESLPRVFRGLETVGLTTRGACGGAVRGITCAVVEGEDFSRMRMLVKRLQEHFTGNPYFEGLPKKFKLAVEKDDREARHLCQDLAMVYLGRENGRDLCDVWVAGGLGRQPQEGFLLAGRVPFERLIPLVEGVVKVYRKHTPAGKRLKHLVADIGEKEFRALLAAETGGAPVCPLTTPLDEAMGSLSTPAAGGWIELPVFAGELLTADLRRTAAIVREHGDGFLAVSREQNLLASVGDGVDAAALNQALQDAGWGRNQESLPCRICPGTHACAKGLVPTRDVARRLEETLNGAGHGLRWAVSGCFNSCSQPQLADYGIVGVRKENGDKAALYDLYHRDGEGFGRPVRQKLTLDALLQAVKELV